MLTAAGVVLAMAVLAGGGYVLGREDDGDGASLSASGGAAADRRTTPPSEPSPGSAQTEAASTTAPDATASATPTDQPDADLESDPASDTEEQPSTPASITCWNGAAAPSVAQCALPSGLPGLRTVFPDLTETCALRPSTVTGKEEVYECSESSLLVRFSRWTPGFDRYAYYDQSTGIDGQEWWLDGEFAGRRWTTYEATKGLPWQWSASFRNFPYSVSVEAATQALRDERVTTITVRPPSEIGLP